MNSYNTKEHAKSRVDVNWVRFLNKNVGGRGLARLGSNNTQLLNGQFKLHASIVVGTKSGKTMTFKQISSNSNVVVSRPRIPTTFELLHPRIGWA